ncbi:MAG: hypothetical protein HYV95_14125 [Opitutae bacterium]|nr:hypothetical protein [Opitutae bacterium]
MKLPLIALLALSLAGNAVLAYLAFSPTLVQPAAPSVVPPASATRRTESGTPHAVAADTPARAAAPAPGAKWRSPRSDHEIHALVADLRSAGFPGAVVRAVVNQLLAERYAALQPDASLPYWKRGFSNPELLDAQQALNREKQKETDALLGPDARPSAVLDAPTRERRYGTLNDEQVDAVVKIEHDYNDVRTKLNAQRENGAPGLNNLMQQMATLEKEKAADLAAVLSPAELEQYEMRNSQTASRLINYLGKVDLNESEYAAVYRLQKSFDDANPQQAISSPAAYAQRQAATLAASEQIRTVLGEDRFYKYAEAADFAYANVARFAAKYPAITPAVSYQVYQLQAELQRVMLPPAGGGGPPNAARIQELRTQSDAANQKLEALIGPEAAEAYRKDGLGRVFGAFRNQPRPASPTGG